MLDPRASYAGRAGRIADLVQAGRCFMASDSGSPMQALFDRGGLRAIFDHARNVVVATIIITAGLETAKRVDTTDLIGLHNPLYAGYVVAGVGCILVVLNFIDGLRRLARLPSHRLMQIALGIAYLFVSVRIVQLVILLRSLSC
ncbi:hypothetical protein ACXU4B_09795 [Dyella soli]|uniref:Uncharacterized protein n=1 Tax=Dyella soli TaxID=522319 RepID=A0A4R0Z031_9GAMM|nr:hypothetical protein [Dyella soli]TCI11224.1 hypothetical protein EZM97_20685 [Dyella soli]